MDNSPAFGDLLGAAGFYDVVLRGNPQLEAGLLGAPNLDLSSIAKCFGQIVAGLNITQLIY
jgi:hypothetical protein